METTNLFIFSISCTILVKKVEKAKKFLTSLGYDYNIDFPEDSDVAFFELFLHNSQMPINELIEKLDEACF